MYFNVENVGIKTSEELLKFVEDTFEHREDIQFAYIDNETRMLHVRHEGSYFSHSVLFKNGDCILTENICDMFKAPIVGSLCFVEVSPDTPDYKLTGYSINSSTGKYEWDIDEYHEDQRLVLKPNDRFRIKFNFEYDYDNTDVTMIFMNK